MKHHIPYFDVRMEAQNWIEMTVLQKIPRNFASNGREEREENDTR